MPEPRDVTAELIVAHRRGDRSAAGRLVEYLRAPLLRAAIRVLGDPVSAEDVFVESMARLLPLARAGVDPEGFWSYAHRTVRNRSVDVLRRRHERDSRRALRDTRRIAPRFAPHDAVSGLPSRRPGPEQQVLAMETRRRVRAEVERLREPGRTIVRRFYDDGLHYRQIGDELGMSVTAVKRQLAAARDLLARRLQREEAADER